MTVSFKLYAKIHHMKTVVSLLIFQPFLQFVPLGIVILNTIKYEHLDPNRWLPAVCKDICTVPIDTSCTNEDGSVKFNLTNEMTSNVIVKEYTIGKCSKCHQLKLFHITCKTDGITCKDCTNAKSKTDISSTISTPHLSLCLSHL